MCSDSFYTIHTSVAPPHPLLAPYSGETANKMGGGGLLYVVAGQLLPVNNINFYTRTREVMLMCKFIKKKLNVEVSKNLLLFKLNA